MKNTLGDLNNHLFAALERLNDEDLTEENLRKEATRAREITLLAGKIIENANLAVQASKILTDAGADYTKCEGTILSLIGGSTDGGTNGQ